MRDLISERPNVVPVGIGNSASSIDMSEYLNPVTNSTDYEGVNSVGVSDEECGGDATSEGQDITEPEGDGGDAEIHVPAKRKAAETSTHVQKPNTHAGGTPAVKQEPKKTRTTMMDKFSDIAKAQEDTAQRAIDMKVKRLELTKETDIARIKAQERVQVGRDRQRAEIKLQKIKLEQDKLRLDYELKLAQVQANRPAPFITAPPFMGDHISGAPSSSSTSFSSPAHTSTHLSDGFHFGDIPVGSMETHTALYLPNDQDTEGRGDGNL